MYTVLLIVHAIQMVCAIVILGYRFQVASRYRKKVKRVQSLTNNHWGGKRLYKRIMELDGDGILTPTEGMFVIFTMLSYSALTSVSDMSLNKIIATIIVVACTALVQWRFVELLKKATHDEFQLKQYMKTSEMTFLMQLTTEHPPAIKQVTDILERRVVSPEAMEPFYLHHDLLLSTMETRNLLKKEIWKGIELEKDAEGKELLRSYNEACDTLQPVLQSLWLAVDYKEPLPATDKRRELMRQQTTELKQLNGKSEPEMISEPVLNPVIADLNRLLNEPDITPELRERAIQTLDAIRKKEDESDTERKEEGVRLDAEATIATARKVYGIEG